MVLSNLKLSMINHKIEKALIEEYATQESTKDTVMGLLLLCHTLATAIKLHYGPDALPTLSDHILSSLSSLKPSDSFTPEALSVLSSNLHLINLMLNDSSITSQQKSVEVRIDSEGDVKKTRGNTGEKLEDYW